MTKNLDKLSDRMKRHFRPKERNNIFVPSSSAAVNGSTDGLTRSTSQVDAPVNSHLSPFPIENRRQSAPSPTPVPVIFPSAPSLAPLSIETFGGECAGSGYDHWLNEDAQLEEEEQQSSYIQAQRISLNMVKQKISGVEEQLRKVKSDSQNLNDFIVSSFPDRVGSQMSPIAQKLREDIIRLKDEIGNLRTLSPRSVPPERPPLPNTAMYWPCPRCADHSPLYAYVCKSCDFPRPAIDPNEAYVCNCTYCLQAVGERASIRL